MSAVAMEPALKLVALPRRAPGRPAGAGNPTTSSAADYDHWIGSVRPGNRGSGGHSKTSVDEAPTATQYLPDYFLRLAPGKLAGCWVACIVDAVLDGAEIGHLARSLIVVAERLHGVKFEEPVMSAMPAAARPAAPEVAFRGDGTPVRPPTPAPALTRLEPRIVAGAERATAAQPMPRAVAGINIERGDPPAEKPSRLGKNAKFFQAATDLKPGEWFYWPDPPGSWRTTVKGWKLPIVAYKIADGRLVVRRLAAPPAAPLAS